MQNLRKNLGMSFLYERLSTLVSDDLQKALLARAQTNPGPGKSAEIEVGSQSSLYTFLEGAKELVTTRVFCAFTGWNIEYVYYLIKYEGLPAHRVRKRGHWKIYIPEFGTWLRDHDQCSLGASKENPTQRRRDA